MLTTEQYNQLKEYKHHFITASSGYFRGLYARDMKVLSPIYESLGKRIGSVNCGNCIVTMLVDLGEACKQYELNHPDLKKLIEDIKKTQSQE